MATPLNQIRTVHASRNNFDQHLICGRYRNITLTGDQHIGFSRLTHFYYSHAVFCGGGSRHLIYPLCNAMTQ
jgi:hypothetical protein